MTQTQGAAELAGAPGDVVPFPFFVGCGRSGTTLVRTMFASHPAVAIPPESEFIVPLARRARTQPGGFSPDAFVTELGKRQRFETWELSLDDLRVRLAGAQTYPDAVRGLYLAYAQARGKTRYMDKTPGYVRHITYLGKLFPESRFVHIIRDGRDVAMSFAARGHGPDSIPEAAVHWRQRVHAGRMQGRALGDSRYREVRYEDLIEDPEGILRGLCEFVELDFDPVMLRYYERVGTILLPDTKKKNLDQPVRRGLRDWRRQMSPYDVEVFEALAGDELAANGYERATTRASLTARMATVPARVRLVTRRAETAYAAARGRRAR